MSNTEQSETVVVEPKPSARTFFRSHNPLIIAALILAGGGIAFGYNIGYRQGLTVVGFDTDAQELAEIVDQQKASLTSVSTALNAATQERDVAIQNAKEINTTLQQAQQEQHRADSMSATYREKLRERGGLSLTIQNMAIKPLPGNAYEYVLDLIQVSPSKHRAAGKIEIRLVHDSEVLVVPMESANYNFDNHQRLSGRWTMPNGFVPQYIEVRLIGAGDAVIQRFAWSRGKAVVETPAFISEIPQTQASAN